MIALLASLQPDRKLFVSNLSWDVDDAALEKAFKKV
jgi:hypothetical protein